MAKQSSPQQSEKNGLSKNAMEENVEVEKPSEGNSRSILAEILTMPDTPTTRQRFKYNKDQLIAISKTTGAKLRPSYLQLEFFNDFGIWDPEKWVLNERNDDGQKSVLDEPKSKRERPADLDREALAGKRKLADPKERLKEEQDGIVLSPQRRSFGTGCHVTQQSTGNNRRSESPPDLRNNERENHREPSRRIGSGRFFSREREREFGYRNNDRRDSFERDNGRDRGRNDRDRFRRDDLKSNREMSNKERDYDRRGSKDKGFRRIEEEEEPEWFSGGPTSQSEFIELRGFDEPNDEDDLRGKDGNKRERKKSWRKPKSPTIMEEVVDKSEGKEISEKKSRVAVNHAASATTSSIAEAPLFDKNSEDQERVATGFDFGDLFKFDNMTTMAHPSLSPENADTNLGGSRFGQFFRREPSPINNSTDTSRRSSFQDELIAPIIGNLSDHGDLVASPTSGSDTYFAPISPAQLTKSSSDSSKHLLNIIQSNRDDQLFIDNESTPSNFPESSSSKDLRKMEADLKSLVLGTGNSNQQNGNQTDANGPDLFQSSSNGASMNAFEKLLSQISDGRVTPASSRNSSFSGYENEDRKTVQGGEFHVPTGQSKIHMMDILKHAPTEQDLLNGFLNGNATRSMPQDNSQKANDFLSLFSAQNQEPAPSLDAVLMKSLNKTNTNHGVSQQDHSSYMYTNIDSVQKAPKQLLVKPNLKSNARGSATGSASSQHPPANSIQQQQREILAAILKQQQQQQQQVGPPRQPSPIQPPAIQHSRGSPNMHSQSHLANGPISPISMSPSHSFMQHPQRPNIPSPLMFRQDPPPISHAPSPIHPSQMVQSMAPVASLNSNTLQVQAGHILARVPSPQELRAHTQQIMQNALIKKKLEEQKENFRKRQEMQESQSSITNKFVDSGALGKAPSGLSPSLSIIPTSVMRKMQVGKDKDVAKISSPIASNQPHQQNAFNSLVQLGAEGKLMSHSLVSQSGGMMFSSDLEKMSKQGQIQQRPVLGQTFSNGPAIGRSSMNLSTNNATNVANHMPLQGRRIVKSSQPGSQTSQQRVLSSNQLLGNQNKSYLSNPGNIDIAKQYVLQQQAAAAQRQLNISPMSTLGHPGLPIRGVNLHSPAVNSVRPSVNLTPNNFLMRNIVHPGPTMNQFNQVTAYQRGVDPRQLQSKSTSQYGQPNLHSLTMSSLLMGVGNNNARSSVPLNSRPIQGSSQSVNSLMGKNDSMGSINVGGHAQMQSQTLNNFLKTVNARGGMNLGSNVNNTVDFTNVSGRESPTSANFDKWFGSDLRQKMPNLPPVPTQKAQYVEEVEQRQQHTTTVQN